MKILNTAQVREVDKLTIEKEPVESIDLMERAALACVKRLIKLYTREHRFVCFCGKGNNGGDGLAIARLLLDNGQLVKAYIIDHTEKFSDDCALNFKRLKEKYPFVHHEIKTGEDLKAIESQSNDVIVEALLGTGVSRKVEGLLKDTIEYINQVQKPVISIDVPAGLNCDEFTASDTVIHSDLTLTFQMPKLAFLLPDNEKYVPEFEILDIGLSRDAMEAQNSQLYYLTGDVIKKFLKKRNKFSHKGKYGHALLMAGSKGKSGAALLSAAACLRSGAGLLTVHADQRTLDILLRHLPEAMTDPDASPDHITEIDALDKYSALGFGPGIGTEPETANVLKKILNFFAGHMVIDADGLNILAANKTLLGFLPPSCILTPHPKEFERLAGKADDDFDRLKRLREFSLKCGCITILKGAHTAVSMPDGTLLFNSTGNASLAKGGTGDVLTGIILGLLARGYNAPQAALIGVYVHGYAADLLIKKKSMEAILASDIIEKLPTAFKKLEA
jgi:ADP-dependent NAD(P)H-hydrate dehydratase / NAD(P)H-hydrate epimerase